MNNSIDADQDWLERATHAVKGNRLIWVPGLVVLVVIAVFVFQKLNATTDPLETGPTVTGHPLSNPDQHLHTLAIDPLHPGTVYLGSHYGLFVSMDDGKSWPQAHGSMDRLMITSLSSSLTESGGVGMIGSAPSGGDFGQNGIYFSHDHGTTWTRAKDPAGAATGLNRYIVVASPNAPKSWLAIYVGVGLYATDDDGQTWRLLRAPASSQDTQRALWVSKTHPHDIFLGSNLGLSVSHDDGAHWSTVPSVASGVFNITASAANADTLYLATDAGIYRSTDDGANFVLVSSPVDQSPFNRIAASTQHPNVVYGLVGQGVWLSTDSGVNWTQQATLSTSQPMSLIVAPNDDQHVYVGFYSPAVAAASTDGGKSWNIIAQ